MYWVVVMHQMGLWFSMKDTQRQPIKKGPASHLVDTFIKVTRWSYLYDDPNLPWIEPWIAPIVEVDNALQLVSAYIRGDQYDYLRLAEEIRDLMPYKVFLIEAGEYPKKSASPDIEIGLQILQDIKQAIGDDVFGLRVLEMYQNNFNDPDYAAAFRVLLRELMVTNAAFFECMKEFSARKHP